MYTMPPKFKFSIKNWDQDVIRTRQFTAKISIESMAEQEAKILVKDFQLPLYTELVKIDCGEDPFEVWDCLHRISAYWRVPNALPGVRIPQLSRWNEAESYVFVVTIVLKLPKTYTALVQQAKKDLREAPTLKELYDLLDDQNSSDFGIVAGVRLFRVHTLIIRAFSRVLKELIDSHSERDRVSKLIEVDCDPDLFEYILR